MAIAFAVSYVLAATFLSVIDLAVAAGVQAWCLDYKQNCIDQHLASAQIARLKVQLEEASDGCEALEAGLRRKVEELRATARFALSPTISQASAMATAHHTLAVKRHRARRLAHPLGLGHDAAQGDLH